MNAVLALLRANLRRLAAERSNLFFLVVLPLLIVFALGTAIGSGTSYRVGVVDPVGDEFATAVRATVEDLEGVETVSVASADDLRDDLARRALDAGWVVTRQGGTRVQWVSGGATADLDLRAVFESAVRTAGAREQVVAVLAEDAGVTPEEARGAVDRAAAGVPATPVTVVPVDDEDSAAAGLQAVIASGQLTLFIFLTSLTGAAYVLTTRQLGVTRRMRAGPVPVAAIVGGEAAGRFAVALLQAGIVYGGSALLFGVDWRAPGAVWLLCAGMALVGTGGAMLLGSLGRSEQQVGAVGLLLGLVLAALGGSMTPLEFFPDTMRTAAFVTTPHAWMNDALWRVLVEGAGLADVWPSVLVLVGIGTALLAAASYAMARSLR